MQRYTGWPFEIFHSPGESGLVERVVEKLQSSWRHRLKENLNVANVLHKVTYTVLLAQHRHFDQGLTEARALEVQALLADRLKTDVA